MRRSKCRILCSLLLCCLFLFSGSLTVFAEDETVLDGYHVDDVPYDTNFDAVLTASDDEYVLFSADNNKTYKSSSVMSVNDVDNSDVLYTAKSVTDFLPISCFGSANKYVRSTVTSSGYTGVSFGWDTVSKTNNMYTATRFAKSFYGILKPSRKYRITFTVDIQNAAFGQFDFNLVDSSNNDAVVVRLFSKKGVVGTNVWLTGKQNVSIDVVMPDDIGTPVGFISANIIDKNSFVFYINDFTITDITSEDLDNSLGKLGDRIKGFFDNLVESIKGFFIPKEGFFETAKEQFDQLLSDHLGFLYEAPSMVAGIFKAVGDWNPPEQPSITLPAFNFTIADHPVHLWDEQVYTFDFLGEQPWSTLYAIYKTFVFVMLSVAMINLAIKKYHNIVGGGSSDDS